jgi:hypothetical protein
MASKKKGGGPPLVPINGKRPKGRSAKVELEPQPHGGALKRSRDEGAPDFPDLAIPDNLLNAKVTTRQLRNGTYQRKILAHFAPALLGEFINSVRRNLHLSNESTQRLTAEMFNFVGAKGGVNVMVNQQNTNTSESKAASASRSAGPSSPDEIFRMLAEEREHRQVSGRSTIQFAPTPAAEFKDKLIDAPE